MQIFKQNIYLNLLKCIVSNIILYDFIIAQYHLTKYIIAFKPFIKFNNYNKKHSVICNYLVIIKK